MNEFFDNGGTTTFVDRVAGSLGIHASTIKVVSVYEGSLVVNYDIAVADPADDTSSSNSSTPAASNATSVADQMAEIKAKQIEAFSTGGMDLGAPISDVELTAVVNEPADNSTSSDNSSSSSNSSSSDSSSSSDDSGSQKIISGGQVTAPGYPPVIFNMDAYWHP